MVLTPAQRRRERRLNVVIVVVTLLVVVGVPGYVAARHFHVAGLGCEFDRKQWTGSDQGRENQAKLLEACDTLRGAPRGKVERMLGESGSGTSSTQWTYALGGDATSISGGTQVLTVHFAKHRNEVLRVHVSS
jgi:hypothetical protein